MKEYQEREIFAYGRYLRCQILNWNEGPPPKYLVCNPLDATYREEFLAEQGMGTWKRVDLRDVAREVAELQRAIMGAEPMPEVSHGQFLEMAKELHIHQRGHENSIRAIGRLLRLCDDNGIGDKARKELEGIEHE